MNRHHRHVCLSVTHWYLVEMTDIIIEVS